MSFLTVRALLLVLATAPPAPVVHGGLLQTLPKVGSWVTYHVEYKNLAPMGKKHSGTITLRMLGNAKEDGKKCVWIEAEVKGISPKHGIIKLLVRRKDLTAKSSTAVVLRGWSKVDDNDPVELPSTKHVQLQQLGRLLRFPLAEAKTIKQVRTIDYQKGRLRLATARTGKLNWNPVKTSPPALKTESRQTVWTHKKIPFGTAALGFEVHLTNTERFRWTVTIDYTVQDYGIGAKSALPGKN